MDDLGFQQQWMVVDVESPEPFARPRPGQQVCDHDRATTFMPVAVAVADTPDLRARRRPLSPPASNRPQAQQ